MTCPLLRRAQTPQCRGVAGGPAAVSRDVLATYCRAAHASCPAFRFLRATGRAAHPADFRAWVVRGIGAGRIDRTPDATATPTES
jgi:hypothetical protein